MSASIIQVYPLCFVCGGKELQPSHVVCDNKECQSHSQASIVPKRVATAVDEYIKENFQKKIDPQQAVLSIYLSSTKRVKEIREVSLREASLHIQQASLCVASWSKDLPLFLVTWGENRVAVYSFSKVSEYDLIKKEIAETPNMPAARQAELIQILEKMLSERKKEAAVLQARHAKYEAENRARDERIQALERETKAVVLCRVLGIPERP
ncbi:MAG: hypothetical protein S4CHLAM45_03710 [Chlamydiales bacterium]|nr:hypothetical protein [Chlamydiales bacterium]MCH9619225.1 hypothetical protein [Chlamydiales bacterium]MCH9622487.1 hypothetical protein [Chlamydiales bacterium]